MSIKDIAEDILLNASDYIGNCPEKFGADNHDLDTIKYCKLFRSYVADEIEICSEEFENLEQKDAAEIVWRMYLSWEYR